MSVSGSDAGAGGVRRLLSRVPLRLRITGWVLAIFAVVHATISLVVVLYHREHVRTELARDLEMAATAFADDGPSSSADAFMIRVLQHARAARWGPIAAVIAGPRGEPAATAGPYDFDAFVSLASGDGQGFLSRSAPLPDGRRLVVAAPEGAIARAVDPVAAVLMLTLPVGLLSTGISTWYVVGLALRPLEQVQHFAEELSVDNVTGRIELDDAGPEVENLRRELTRAMARLEEGYERQARFLANVSHEIKTPISVVRTEADVLLAREDATLEGFRSFAVSASEEMHRLGRMVESFLLLTRIRHGAARVRAQRHGVNDLLMDAVEACAAMAKQYGVRLDPMLLDGEAEAAVEGNAELLDTALTNLIRNAIRFSPKGGRVTLACAMVGDRVMFRIRDFGPGIPDDLADHLFEPFSQSANERRRGRGTGLGLQIAQGIAELHGGLISVRNLERGCVFEFALPPKTTK